MKKKIINKCMKIIKDNSPELNETKLAEIEYGLVAIYLLITKLVIILILAYIIGIFKEVIIFSFLYSIIRSPSFGIHASKSWICLLTSSIIFLGVPYLCLILHITLEIKLILGIIASLFILKNSPADTHKRPIINQTRRKIYKTISIIIALSFSLLSLIITNNYISNCLIFALITQCFIISPLIYKIFKMPYNNYKAYLPMANS